MMPTPQSSRTAIELKRDQPARAVELLASAAPYDMSAPTGRSSIRAASHTCDCARAWKRRLSAGRSWTTRARIGGCFTRCPMRAWPTLSGDTAKARNAYQDFLTLWKNADSDSAILAEAREEFAALR